MFKKEIDEFRQLLKRIIELLEEIRNAIRDNGNPRI